MNKNSEHQTLVGRAAGRGNAPNGLVGCVEYLAGADQ